MRRRNVSWSLHVVHCSLPVNGPSSVWVVRLAPRLRQTRSASLRKLRAVGWIGVVMDGKPREGGYTRDRPDIPPAYGVESGVEGTLTWDRVVRALDEAEIYWIASGGSAGPHLVPVHAAGLAGTIYAGGDQHARWSRNLTTQPITQIGVDFDGLQVISRGVPFLEEPSPEVLARVNRAVDRKYGFSYGDEPLPMWVLTW